MATSLALQLRKHQTAQSSALNPNRSSASFLYDPKQCASIDRETHLLIALSGFNDLVQLDSNVESFRESLFSTSSRAIDRSQLTKEEHNSLNDELERYFAQVLSPFFLHTASHKTLEWLVQRFQVQDYNVDALLFALLPFHETRHFARLLQMCTLNEKSSFGWLQPLQKVGVPLVKSVLHQHFCNNFDRLRFLCDRLVVYAQNNLHITRLAAFITSTFICLLQRPQQAKVNEQLFPLLLQFISKSLKVETSRTLSVSAYTLLAFLCTKYQLAERRLVAFLNRLASNYSQVVHQSTDEFMMTLYTICRHQKNLPVPLPDSLVDQVAPLLINETYGQNPNAQHLLAHVSVGLVHRLNEEKTVAKLDQLLQLLDVNNFVAVQNLLTRICALQDNEDLLPHLTWLVRLIEQRFPNTFDSVLSSSDKSDPENESKLLFASSLFDGSLYIRTDNCSVSLATALSHPARSIRMKAIEKLADVSIDSLQTNVKEVLQNSLQQVFSSSDYKTDESHLKTLAKMLKLPSFAQLIDRDELVIHGLDILRFCANQLNNESKVIALVQDRILTILLQLDFTPNELISNFIEYLMPSTVRRVDILRCLIESEAFTMLFDQELIKQMNQALNSTDNLDTILNDLIKIYSNQSNFALFFQSLYESKTGNRRHLQMISLALLLQSAIRQSHQFDNELEQNSIKLVKLLRLLIESMDFKNRKQSDNEKESINSAARHQLQSICMEKNKLRADFVIGLCLNSIVGSLQSHPISANDSLSKLFESESRCVLYSLFTLICDLNQSHPIESSSKLLANFVKKSDTLYNHQLFVTYWTAIADPSLQARSLSISLQTLPAGYRLTEAQTLRLLVPLSSPNQSIRTLAAQLIRHVNPESNPLLTHIMNSNIELTDPQKACENEVMQESAAQQILPTFIASDADSTSLLQIISSSLKENNESFAFKIGLMKLAQNVQDATFLDTLIEIVNQILDLAELNPGQKLFIQNSFECLLSYFASQSENAKIQYNYKPLITLFNRCLRSSSISSYAINRITPQWFYRLKSTTLRLQLIETLLNECNSKMIKIDHLNLLKKRLTAFTIDCRLSAHLFHRFTIAQTQIVKNSSDKRVRLEKRLPYESNQLGWIKTIVLLEVIQSQDNLKHSTVLLRELFAILSDFLTFEQQPEYLLQLLLLSIHKCVIQPTCDVQSIDVSLVFECLRITKLQSTQRHLLNLLSLLAPHFRSQVIDNLLNTFIGQLPMLDMMKCNDDLSHQVLDRAMNSLLPPLFERGNHSTRIQVLDSFIDALVEMSADRKLHVFENLIVLMDKSQDGKEAANSSLWTVILRLAQRVMNEQIYETNSLELFLEQIISRFSIQVQVQTLLQMLNHLNESYDQNDQLHLNLLLVDQLQKTFASRSFIVKLAEEDLTQEVLHKQFIELLQKILTLFSKTNAIAFTDNSFNDRLSIALDRYIRLLPSTILTQILNDLLSLDQIHIRTRILRILINRLQIVQESDLESESKESTWKSLAGPLNFVISRLDQEKDSENVYLDAQLALLALKLLVDKYPKKTTQATKWDTQLKKSLMLILRISHNLQANHFEIKQQVSDDESIASFHSRKIQFQTAAILCSARICCSLDLNSAVENLPKTLNICLNHLNANQPNALIVASVSSILRLLRHHSTHFGNLLLAVVEKASILRVRLTECFKDRQKLEQMQFKLDCLDTCLAEQLPLRQMLDLFTKTYDKLRTSDCESLHVFVSNLVKKTIAKATKDDQELLKQNLNNLLFQMLAFRSSQYQTSNDELIKRVEKSIIQLISFVLPRYKERTFRMFITAFNQWPASNLPSTDTSGVLCQRLITFYQTQAALSQSLRELYSLIVLPGFAPNAIERLSEDWADVGQTVAPEIRHEIVAPLLSTIATALQHGYSGSTTNEVINELAERLIGPVVQQLGKDYAGQSAYEQRIEEGVGLCVSAFVRGCSNFNTLKQLHLQILPHTRARSEHIRMGSLQVLQQFIAGASEEYVTYLPDAVPFLVELYEDNSELVQRRLITLLRDVEQLIGEPISNYM